MARAAEGNWLVLLSFFAVFALAFVLIGCLGSSKAKADRYGAALAVVVAVALLALSITGLSAGGAGAVLKLVLAVGFCALAWVAIRGGRRTLAH
jgi:hypothetical protein